MTPSPVLRVADVDVSPDHYIDGRRLASPDTFEVHRPIDGVLLGRVANGSPAHVEAAITTAQRAFPAWSVLGAAGRKPVFDRFAEEIGRRAHALCQTESNDAGVLLSRMRHGVVPRAMLNITWFAEHALRLQDRRIETEQATHLVRHDPAGVVVVITPWNAPLMLSTRKLGRAPAAGDTCILKPPEWAPLNGSQRADAAHAADLPPGVLNVVRGIGSWRGGRRDSGARPDSELGHPRTSTGAVVHQGPDGPKAGEAPPPHNGRTAGTVPPAPIRDRPFRDRCASRRTAGRGRCAGSRRTRPSRTAPARGAPARPRSRGDCRRTREGLHCARRRTTSTSFQRSPR